MGAGVWLAAAALVAAAAQERPVPSVVERPLPDFETFSAKVKEHLATDSERQSGYASRSDGSSRSWTRGRSTDEE